MFVLIHTLATFIVALIATRPQDGELILFFVLGSMMYLFLAILPPVMGTLYTLARIITRRKTRRVKSRITG
jgi:hypothetical protein